MERKVSRINYFLLLAVVSVYFVTGCARADDNAGYDGPTEYLIEDDDNYFDYQKRFECSGYASAYVLRSLGNDVDGLTLYEQIPNKYADGTVSIEALVSFLNESYCAKVYSGSLRQLEKEVSKGVPVIVFVRTQPNQKYYHYLPIVGFDDHYIYAADSISSYTNADNTYYNRQIPISDFMNMWDTGVADANTYIVITNE